MSEEELQDLTFRPGEEGCPRRQKGQREKILREGSVERNLCGGGGRYRQLGLHCRPPRVALLKGHISGLLLLQPLVIIRAAAKPRQIPAQWSSVVPS